jgi:hypothetical protein
MSHRMRTELIILQCPLALLDDEAAGARKDPFVTFLEADAAIAFCDRGELGDLDVEFEGATVAVAKVGLQLWGWCWLGGLRHGGFVGRGVCSVCC